MVDLSDLNRYRLQLMGVATLMILACHAPASHVLMPGFMARILGFGNYGVDIFLLVSGLGCYYSLAKLNNCNLLLWYKKRFYRIFTPYLLIYFPYCIILLFLKRYNVCDCLLSLSALEYWFFHRGAWFVSLILFLYLLSPVLFRIISCKNTWVVSILFIVTLTFLSNITIENSASSSLINNIRIAFSRAPSFIVGMAIAPGCKSGKSFPSPLLLVLASLGVATRLLFNINQGLEWTVVPLIVSMAIVLIKAMYNIRWINKSLSVLGGISLESYLTNITLNSLFIVIIPTYFNSPFFYGRWFEYCLVLIVGVTLAISIKNTVIRISEYSY